MPERQLKFIALASLILQFYFYFFQVRLQEHADSKNNYSSTKDGLGFQAGLNFVFIVQVNIFIADTGNRK